ncbi:MAG TPA: hypothetical protein DD434_04160 [Bacteroidales bacterium]|nr:hypothetical protein [Bacteroidales bacterium]
MSNFADISVKFKVQDFSIMGDSIYFCGYMNTVDEGFKGSTQGFIAYIKISDLFSGQNNFQYNYSRVPTTTHVNKIKTYYNNLGERVVVGIGKQYYSAPIYQCPVGAVGPGDPNPPIPTPDCWVYPDTNQYDCFIGYKITETVLNPSYPSVNPFSIYRHEFAYDDLNNPYEYEEFRDLIVTDNYICLASIYYFNPSSTGNASNGNYIVLRKFNKNDFSDHDTYKVLAPFNPYNNIVSGESGFYVEELEDKNIALVTVSSSFNGNNFATIVNKIDLGVSPFNVVHTSYIDYDYQRALVKDIEYIPETEQLLVLKYKFFNNIDNVFYVNMSNTAYDNSSNYISNRLMPNSIFQYQDWNNILKYNSSHFVLIGSLGTKLGLFDNYIGGFNSVQCRNYTTNQISKTGMNNFIQWGNLLPCTFALMYPYVPGFYYPGNTTIIHKMDIMPTGNASITTRCLEE